MDSKVLKRMERFEAVMAEVIDMTPEWIRNNRFESHEGYKLPRLAHDYRVYCATLKSFEIELPKPWQTNVGAMLTPNGVKFSIESAGAKWK